MQVGLVDMPFSYAGAPSCSLGTFKSYMEQLNIPCKVFNYHFKFAAKLGFEEYSKISDDSRIFESLWVFARKAFPGMNVPDFSLSPLADMDATTLFEIRIQAEEFLEEILIAEDWTKYNVVGFATYTQQQHSSFAMGRAIKQSSSNTIIVHGGPSVYGECGLEFLEKMPWIDLIFLAEADESFTIFCKNIRDGKSFFEAVENLPGIAYRNKEGKVVHVPGSDKVAANSIPLPSFDDYIEEIKPYMDDPFFQGEREFYLPLEWSRGCYYGDKKTCTFCAIVEMVGVARARDPDNALELLKAAHSSYYPTINKFDLMDPLYPKSYTKTVLPKWLKEKRRLGLTKNEMKLQIQSKVWHQPEEIDFMSDAGIYSITFGIEQLSQEALDSIAKGSTAADGVATLKWCKNNQVAPKWSYLIQIPGENPQWYSEVIPLIPLLYHLPPPQGTPYVSITKFQPYYHERHKYNFPNLGPDPKYYYVFPSEINVKLVAFGLSYDGWGDPEPYAEIIKAIDMWKHIFVSQRPYVRFSDHLVIEDSRDGNKKQTTITNDHLSILEHCDRPVSARSISQFDNDLVNELIDWGFLICLGKRYLSLVETPREQADPEWHPSSSCYSSLC